MAIRIAMAIRAGSLPIRVSSPAQALTRQASAEWAADRRRAAPSPVPSPGRAPPGRRAGGVPRRASPAPPAWKGRAASPPRRPPRRDPRRQAHLDVGPLAGERRRGGALGGEGPGALHRLAELAERQQQCLVGPRAARLGRAGEFGDAAIELGQRRTELAEIGLQLGQSRRVGSRPRGALLLDRGDAVADLRDLGTLPFDVRAQRGEVFITAAGVLAGVLTELRYGLLGPDKPLLQPGKLVVHLVERPLQ